MSFLQLTKAQQRALLDVVVRNGLVRIKAGRFVDGSVAHRIATFQRLERRGACRVGRRTVEPSASGRRLVVAAFGSLDQAYLAACDVFARR